jgi:hypothetical protein
MFMTDNNRRLIQKITAIICLFCLTAAVLIAWLNPAKGYELNIYESTPILVWILITLAILGGIVIIILGMVTRDNESINYWILGLAILIISRFSILYIPYIRDYVTWSGDNIRYWGLIKDIVLTGHFSSDNFYPITHIAISNVILITKMPLAIVANLSTAFISMLFVLSTYLFVGAITRNKRLQIISLVISGSVMLLESYNVILAPNGWSIIFMPLLFYLYLNQTTRKFRVLFVILLLVYPFFHPLSSFMLIIMLIILGIMNWIVPHFLKKYLLITTPPLMIYAVIEFTIFILWIIPQQLFNSNIEIIWQQITSGVGSGKLAELGENLNKLNIHGIDFYVLLLKMFGADIILIILSIIGIICLLIIGIKKRRFGNNSQELLPFACVFCVCGIFYLAYLLGLPGTSSLGQGQMDRRFLGYAEILIPLFAAFPIYILLESINFRRLAYFAVFCLIGMSSILSIVALYNSPIIEQPNAQVTLMDMTGTQWFINAKDDSVNCTYISSSPVDYAYAILGTTETENWINIYGGVSQLPDHFGYDEQSSLGTQYISDQYMVINQSDKIVYSTVWKTVGRFNTVDFEKLRSDFDVNKLYSNSEMDIYYIYAHSSIE